MKILSVLKSLCYLCTVCSISNIRSSLNICSLFVSPRYKPSETTPLNEDVQYAVAINVPASQCKAAIDQNFLSGEKAEDVKKDLKEKNLYQGQQLVAATPPTKGKKSSKIHSERALLMCGDTIQADTPVKNLLNKNKEGCVVFYTYNSPCLDYCLNQERDEQEANSKNAQKAKGKTVTPAVEKCILKSLSILSEHQGPKAFVFRQVYRIDKGDEKRDMLAAALMKVANQVPLYKCDAHSCVKCLNNNEIITQCLS